LHGTLVPFAFIEQLGLFNIPLALIINFIFLMLDHVGERIADPFENRLEDTPLTSISLTIEENLKEMHGSGVLPVKPHPVLGVVF
jgi:putative membrane protein